MNEIEIQRLNNVFINRVNPWRANFEPARAIGEMGLGRSV